MSSNNVNKLLTIAGDNGKYQYVILVFGFLYWVTLELLAVSLPYLEKTSLINIFDPSTATHHNVSLNYSLCEKDHNKTFLNNTVERSGHSWVIEFNIECDQVKTGLIGSFTFLGVLVGSILFQYLPDTIGRKNSVIIGATLFSITLILFNFIHDYISAYFLSFLLQTFGCLGTLTIFMFSTEITAIEKRSVFGAIINSAFSASGVFFILLYKHFDNWRLNFNVACLITMTVTVLFSKFAIESPRYFSAKEDNDNMIKSLSRIAKFNSNENEFKKEIELNSVEDKEIIDCTIDKISSNEDECAKLADSKVSQKEASGKYNTIREHPIKSPPSLLNHPTLRRTFLINCFIWFSTSGIYYGLSIYLKNLPGDLYYNGIFIYLSEVLAYILSAWIINIPHFGRRGSMILFEFISLLGYVNLIVFDFNNYYKTLLSFLARFAISGVYNIIFTYTNEIYPTVVRAKGFGFNSICARLGGILFPLLIELLDSKVIIVFTFLNLVSLLLIFLLPETYGKPLEDYIK